ncbi:MAG: VOC family protein [Kiritimatiellia bacterium]|jgi:catechol 2,3-dioxygenase-like lactoylglutathione lyase family enzyme
MITGIAHVCFTVSDLDRAIAFYSGKLGLPVAFDFRNDAGVRFGVYFRLGRRTFLELFQGEVAPKADKQSFSHICLETDDLHETVAAFRARGVEVEDPKMGCDNAWQAWLADPDGNRIELHQYLPDSWQTPHLQ